MKFLRVENRSNYMPSIELFSTLGLSSSRGNENSIGQFGSGYKYMLSLFAREGLLERCKQCIGLDVYTFQVKGKALRDASGRNILSETIVMKKQGGGTNDLNLSVQFGGVDWYDISMGLRELISNSADGAEQYNGSYDSFNIEIVEENEVRASKDTIRFYIPLVQSVQAYILKLGINFLCLMPDYDKSQTILPSDNDGCKIYKKGVLVGSYAEKSLFNYNICNLALNEARIVDSNVALNESARQLCAKATKAQAELYVEEILLKGREDLWESRFSSYYFDISAVYNDYGNKKVWQDAIEKVLGGTILVNDEHQYQMASSRGYSAFKPKNSNHIRALENLGMKNLTSVLNIHDLAGREIVDTNENTRNVFEKVWSTIERLNMLSGKEKPELKTYVQNGLSTGCSNGFYHEGCVYVRRDFQEDRGMNLISILLEECAHHITQSTDGARDFQEYAFRVAAELMLESFNR